MLRVVDFREYFSTSLLLSSETAERDNCTDAWFSQLRHKTHNVCMRSCLRVIIKLLLLLLSPSLFHLFCLVLCMQLACCCGSAACSCCCKCCPKIKQSTGTRIMYALYFLLVTVLCAVMMSPTVEQALKENVSTYITSFSQNACTLLVLPTTLPTPKM